MSEKSFLPKWDYEKDIEYGAIDKAKVRDNKFLFELLAIGSFIEITSDTYAKNLSEYYADNAEAVEWLQNQWEIEEVQHGKALKAYVEHVWPEFNWEEAYSLFLDEYLPMCKTEAFQPSKGLEMLARMIVETGTSTAYRSIESYANELNEPVLEKLAHFIYKDEVNHYHYFDKYFRFYNSTEKKGRKELVQAILQRLREANSEDVETAFRAVYRVSKGQEPTPKDFEAFKENVSKMAKKHYPYNMAIKMMLHPLSLNKTLEATIVPVLRGGMKILGL
jgi:hypothetical protein